MYIHFIHKNLHGFELWLHSNTESCCCCSEHCEKYAKAEDNGSKPEESSDAELSDGEYESSDEEMAGPSDP